MICKTETKYKRKSEHMKLNRPLVIETKLISKRKWLHEMFYKIRFFSVLRLSDKQTRHHLQRPPPQHWSDSSFCRRNCSSRGQKTTRVSRALVPRCKPRLTSTCMNFGHLCQKKMPYLLEQTAGSLSTACLTGEGLLAAPTSQPYVDRVFSVCGWLTACHRNRLSKNLEMSVLLKLNKDFVWLCDRVDARPVDVCLPSCFCVTKL